jgi:glucokinase
MILAGDVGGTKTNLGLFTARRGKLEQVRSGRFPSREYPGLAEVVTEFLSVSGEHVEHAAFGVAGPVVRGRSDATNLSWVVDAAQLRTALGIPSVTLINDLVATAAGLLDIPEEDLTTLFPGRPQAQGTRAVLAPGTGLGQAALVWDGTTHHPLPSEGGHADFAPRNETEIDLLRYLLERQPRVSYEHILAGPGITRIYEFLRDTGRGEEPPWLTENLRHAPDRNAVISRAGLDGKAGICVDTLDLWATILGAEAGNLALRDLSTGGVFLGGGIVVKLIEKLRDGRLVEAYLDKGRLRGLVEKIPLRVVLNDDTALLGAARIALENR